MTFLEFFERATQLAELADAGITLTHQEARSTLDLIAKLQAENAELRAQLAAARRLTGPLEFWDNPCKGE